MNAQITPQPQGPTPRPTLKTRLVWTTIALSVSAALGIIVIRSLNLSVWGPQMPLIASSGFVMTAVFGGAFTSRFGRLMLAGLVCCWLGDMLGPHDFMTGAYAFLVAHVFLILAFLTLGVHWPTALRVSIPLGSVSLFQLVYLLPHVPPSDKPGIIAYTIVITVMVFCACGLWKESRLLAIAAILFYVSDHFVGRWRYIGGSWNGYVCYPLYYAACLHFAYSVYQLTPQTAISDRLKEAYTAAE